jgi:hypothetical protein
VDYIRWYDEDPGDKTAPAVTLTFDGDPSALVPGQPTTFRVHAEDKDGKLVSVQLFAKGYLRAETKIGTAQTDQTFTISNLFEGDNTLIATAVDNDGLVGLSAPVRVKVKSTQSPKK